MPEELEDLAYCLRKAADYRNKAVAVTEPGLKTALEAVARAYVARARELDPGHLQSCRDCASWCDLRFGSKATFRTLWLDVRCYPDSNRNSDLPGGR